MYLISKKFLSFLLVMLMVFTLVPPITNTTTPKVKASENVLDVYEQSYADFAKQQNFNYLFRTSASCVLDSNPNLTVIKNSDTVGSNNTWVTLDGNYVIKGKQTAGTFALTSYLYVGKETSVKIAVPDKIRFHCISNVDTETKDKVTTYDYTFSHSREAYVTSIGTTFNYSNFVPNTTNLWVSLIVPVRVTTIDARAFENNTKLLTVDFKGSIQSIGDAAFKGCNHLENLDLTGMWSAMNTIPSYCFAQCNSLENVIIPDTVINISDHAFYQCNQIEYLVIPDTVQSIGNAAFANCEKMRYLYIPNDGGKDWTNIVDKTEASKIIVGELKDKIEVVRHGDTTPISSVVYNTTRVDIRSKIDLKPGSVSVSTKTGKTVTLEPYYDNTYGYKTLAYRFTMDTPDTYYIQATDLAGTYSKCQVVYSRQIEDVNAPSITVAGDGDKDTFRYAYVTVKEDATSIHKITINDVEITDISKETQLYTFSIIEEGTYVVKATDWTGNVSEYTFVIDKTAPVIKGIKNNDQVKSTVVMEVADESEIKAVLINGVAQKLNVLKYYLTTSDNYTVQVTDMANNTTTYNFVIDAEGPSLKNIIPNHTYNKNITCKFNSVVGVNSATITYTNFKNDKKVVSDLKNGQVITKNGVYDVKIVDALGSVYSTRFVIDKTAPIITGIKNNQATQKDVKIKIKDTQSGIRSIVLDDKNANNLIYVTEEGKHVLVVEDLAGNVTKIVFYIDRTAPKMKGAKNGDIKKGTVTLKFNGTKSPVRYVDINHKRYEGLKKIKLSKTGVYKVTVVDWVGLKTSYRFTIDNTAPKTNVVNKKTYSTPFAINVSDKHSGVASIILDGRRVANGRKVWTKGKHTLVVVDNKGNKATYKFTTK